MHCLAGPPYCYSDAYFELSISLEWNFTKFIQFFKSRILP